MEKGDFFEKNLLALSRNNRDSYIKLSAAGASSNYYKFMEARSGEKIPFWTDSRGVTHQLHSTIDPVKEAKRLIESVEKESFLVLLGFGGGFHTGAALEREDLGAVLVIEYNADNLAELLCGRDYSGVFEDPRFHLLVDPSEQELVSGILNLYQPVLYSGIRVIPLRSRTTLDAELFSMAGKTIEDAIARVSADYSVQAHFGQRWFSNTVRNLLSAGVQQATMPRVRRAAVSAAGPSLEYQTERLKKTRDEVFLIAVDTSLPCLLAAGIAPDAVISIDCQHISYYHFMNRLPEGIPLFLDLASPPLLKSRAGCCLFFTGGHPLTRYISNAWKALPELDTSGGNVTYAALSLAEQSGAVEIELYGADFSYPLGVTYAKGAYIYPYFENRQNRLMPLEAQASAFLYRTPLEKKNVTGNGKDSPWYYETGALRFYRERLEEKSSKMKASLIVIEGRGAPICIAANNNNTAGLRGFSSGSASLSPGDFLKSYREQIALLPVPEKNAAAYLASLTDEGRTICTTLLPTAAAIKRRHSPGTFRETLEQTKAYCLKQLDLVINTLDT